MNEKKLKFEADLFALPGTVNSYVINLQSNKDGDYKFVLNYQDHLSKYICLRPLKTKAALEVAYHLIDIFCTFGALSTLQSDNIIHGKPRHSQSQGSIERANRDVGDMLRAWMADNKTEKWHEGLRFVQYQKNSSFHRGIQQTPFEVLFGRKASLGLGSTTLPASVANALQSEDDISSAFTTTPPINENSNHEASSSSDLEENDGMRAKLRGGIEVNRKRAIEGLEKQAKRMRLASEAKFGVLNCGTTVTIPVPDVDRRKCNLRNLIGRCD